MQSAEGNAAPPEGDLSPKASQSLRFMLMVLGQVTLQLVIVLMTSSKKVGDRMRRPRPREDARSSPAIRPRREATLFFQRGST